MFCGSLTTDLFQATVKRKTPPGKHSKKKNLILEMIAEDAERFFLFTHIWEVPATRLLLDPETEAQLLQNLPLYSNQM